jgi:hypothetical protein
MTSVKVTSSNSSVKGPAGRDGFEHLLRRRRERQESAHIAGWQLTFPASYFSTRKLTVLLRLDVFSRALKGRLLCPHQRRGLLAQVVVMPKNLPNQR